MGFERLKGRARKLKGDVYAIYLACQDPRTPWYAKVCALCVVSYAFSPIDLIPDMIPILGYLDDLLLVPLGVALVLKLLPPAVLEECREKAESMRTKGKPKSWVGATVIVSVWILCLALVVGFAAQHFRILLFLGTAVDEASATARIGLTVRKDGTLLKDGQPYRGIGVNYFDAFARALADPKDTSYERGFRELAARGIPFARFMACGYWPRDMKLYLTDRPAYFARLDGVVRAAERYGVGLIPSLYWHSPTVPDLVDEPVSAWGNPSGKTHAFMRRYTREVVRRYRNSPAIWGWEFGNEFNLGASLPNAAEHRPPVWPDLGTPPRRTEKDEWTYEAIRTAFRAFAQEVRRHDPHRMISTGDAFPRPSAWHNWKERTWMPDTPQQYAEMLRRNNPDPVDVVSVHAYGEDAGRIAETARLARRVRKPLFVGEFGTPGPSTSDTIRRFEALLREIERSGAPLAALWVYDFKAQDEWTVTSDGPRSYQLKAIEEANRRLSNNGPEFTRTVVLN